MDQDDFKLKDDTMRDLRRIAQSPGEFEWRMELLTKLERINQRHDLFARAVVAELKQLKEKKVDLTKLSKHVNIELDARMKPARNVAKQVGKAALWILERCLLLFFAYLGVRLGLKT